MSVSQNSNHSVLSNEEQDYLYRFVQFFHEISTDLKNAELMMDQGKFFKAMDYIRQCNIKAQIGERNVGEFVEDLKRKGWWV